MTSTPDRAAEFIALTRANLSQAKAQLCSHGVPPTHCKERHDPTTETATEQEPT